MLIRPKRIYNFCLLHACFVWYCYDLDTLSYTFDHIWTNLLTQCTPVTVPVFCCFSISVFPHIKSARKIRENSDKKSAWRTLREEPGRGQRGARGAPGAPGPPLGAPLRLFILRHGKTPEEEPYSANSPLFRRCRASEDREHQKTSSRHPAGGRIDLRESPLHHGCSSDVS